MDKTNPMLRIPLQFFAEEDVAESPVEEVAEAPAAEESETPADLETPAEEPKYTVKYNGQEMELPVSELVKSAQKGMNYDHVRDELETLRQTKAALEEEAKAKAQLRNALKLHGFDGTDEEVATLIAASANKVSVEEQKKIQQEEQERLEAAIASDPRYQRMLAADRSREISVRGWQDLKDIKEHFPDVTATTINDIPNVDAFVKHRYTLGADGRFTEKMSAAEAYALANLMSKPKHTPPSSAEKDHLIAKGGGVKGDTLKDIPADELQVWAAMFPDESKEKLKQRYNNAQKRG